jgi:hypothetical protein
MTDFVPLKSLNLPNDAVATFKAVVSATPGQGEFSLLDALGRPVAVPAALTFANSAPGIDSVSFDGSTLAITPTADGTDTVSIIGLTASLDVTVSAPVAVSAVFGTPAFIVKP